MYAACLKSESYPKVFFSPNASMFISCASRLEALRHKERNGDKYKYFYESTEPNYIVNGKSISPRWIETELS